MKKIFLVLIPMALLAASCSATPPPDYSKQLNDISANLAKLNEKPAEASINDKFIGYQAVFLANGQVYFGKLSEFNTKYLLLTDVYYLQTTNGSLQGMSPGSFNDSAAQPQISLVKLGSGLHGPQDAMYLERTNVLFFENLKPDGQVMKAILADKNSGR